MHHEFRRPRPDRSSRVVLDPVDFLERLAALVPAPLDLDVLAYRRCAAVERQPQGGLRAMPPASPEVHRLLSFRMGRSTRK